MASGIMQFRGLLPCFRHVGREFRITLHHAQHVAIGHVQHAAHVPSDRGEGFAVHGQSIRVRFHVVQRAYESPVVGECGQSVDDVDPLAVRMFFQQVGCAVVVYGKYLIVVLAPVLHEQQRAAVLLPYHARHVLVGFAVPFDFVECDDGVTALIVEVESQQVEVYVGVGGQCARVAASGCWIAWVGGVADVPHRFGCGVEGFDDDLARIRPPPEAVVSVHFLSGYEFGESDFPGVGDFVRAGLRTLVVRFGRIGQYGIVVVIVIVRFDAGGQQGDVAVGFAVVGILPFADAYQLQSFAGGVEHVLAVWADAWVEHGCGAGFDAQTPGAQFAHRGFAVARIVCAIRATYIAQFSQEQAAVQREHHA